MQGNLYDSTDGTDNILEGLDVTGTTSLNAGLTVDGQTSVTGATSINTTGDASTIFGTDGNATSILSSSVSIGTGAYETHVDVNNIDSATTVAVEAGQPTFGMNNTSINASVTSTSEGTATGVVSVSNDASKYVADQNGKIIFAPEGSAEGVTAAVVVTDSTNSTDGLVVEQTKTTISGGLNSSSLTLNDAGATVSDPANGAPIQVHGVANGTAPFDATNVRQVYSCLAAVLAAPPDLALAPGKTGFGMGLGSYGGYNAMGLGIGHMYDKGAVLTGSASKAPESKVAYKASLAWTW